MQELLAPPEDVKSRALTVSQLNGCIKQLLERNFAQLWVEGEISNLRGYDSGHLYFTLKDEYSQIRAVMFRGYASTLAVLPKNGDRVLVQAEVSLYLQRGEHQLIVRRLLPVGIGNLYQRFLQLKAELQQLGWFSASAKQPLPPYPRTLGVITSPSGAVVRDIINISTRRAPWVNIIIYPTLVQGELAAGQIAQAIKAANQRRECDLLIVGRGGGSLEDLYPFNERVVAEAIWCSQIPIISAVGHETDFSISDFVADLRASTPSAAAELATAQTQRLLLNYLAERQQQWQLILTRRWQQQRQQLALHAQTFRQKLIHKITSVSFTLQHLKQIMIQGLQEVLQREQQKLDLAAEKLRALNPECVMQRGFTLIKQQDTVITSVQSGQLDITQPVTIQWHDGMAEAKIIQLKPLKPIVAVEFSARTNNTFTEGQKNR